MDQINPNRCKSFSNKYKLTYPSKKHPTATTSSRTVNCIQNLLFTVLFSQESLSPMTRAGMYNMYCGNPAPISNKQPPTPYRIHTIAHNVPIPEPYQAIILYTTPFPKWVVDNRNNMGITSKRSLQIKKKKAAFLF